MKEKSLEKRRELLKIIDSLPESVIKDVKLVISGYVACHDSIQQTKEPA